MVNSYCITMRYRNTAYFHPHASQSKVKNFIASLEDSSGWTFTIHDKNLGPCGWLYLHINGVLWTLTAYWGYSDPGIASRKIQGLLAENMEWLNRLFTSVELLQALKDMSPTMMLGIDGFPALFYQQYFGIVGPYALRRVLGFLNGSEDINALNETFLVLISKVKTTKKVT